MCSVYMNVYSLSFYTRTKINTLETSFKHHFHCFSHWILSFPSSTVRQQSLNHHFLRKWWFQWSQKNGQSLFSSLNYQWIIMILKMILKITFKEIYILMMRLEHSLNHHCSENDDFNDNETKCQSLFSSLIYQLIKKGSWRLHCSFLIGLDILRHFVWIWEEGDESQKNSKLLWHWI